MQPRSRARSRASSGLVTSEYDHSPHGEYQSTYGHHHDDSGIDLEVPGHSRRSSGAVSGVHEVMRPAYDYR